MSCGEFSVVFHLQCSFLSFSYFGDHHVLLVCDKRCCLICWGWCCSLGFETKRESLGRCGLRLGFGVCSSSSKSRTLFVFIYFMFWLIFGGFILFGLSPQSFGFLEIKLMCQVSFLKTFLHYRQISKHKSQFENYFQ